MKIYSKKINVSHKKAQITQCKNNPHWSTGINRRDFVKSALAISLLASISACKPTVENNHIFQTPAINNATDIVALDTYSFSSEQQLVLQSVFMRLFPDDGDGPSANGLNVVTYLEWAMTDAQNIADGDAEYIKKGIGWLDQLATDNLGKNFRQATNKQQDKLITQTINSDAGKRWVSLLTYYLIEALTLDPYYGGNTNQVGWKWLQHQGGFPQPIAGKTYRDFE